MATLCDGCKKVVALCTCSDRDPTDDGGTQASLFAYEPDELGQLSKMQRKVYTAVEDEGKGPRQLARDLELAPGTVGNHLQRAREKVEEGASDA